jgi:hypothetical protein
VTSRKQVEANRRNALKSTGPRTKKGKTRSSRNALQHGVTATMSVVSSPPHSEHARLLREEREALRADLRPRGAMEEFLIEKMATLRVRYRLLQLHEQAIVADSINRAVRSWWEALTRKHRRLQQVRGEAGEDPGPDLLSLQDLKASLKERRRELRALEAPDLQAPTIGLAAVVMGAAWHNGISTSRLDEPFETAIRSGGRTLEPLKEPLRSTFEKLRRRWRSSPPATWERLRVETKQQIRELRRDVKLLAEAQDHVARLAALPEGQQLDRLLRYHNAIAREFDRTLQQFKQRHLIRLGLQELGEA